MGEFRQFPGSSLPISADQVLLEPLTWQVLTTLFFGATGSKAVEFAIRSKQGPDDAEVQILSSGAAERWANRICTSQSLPERFSVEWSYDFPVYVGIPDDPHTPQFTTKYRSNQDMQHLILQIKRELPTRLPRFNVEHVWVGVYDLAQPSTVLPLSMAKLMGLPALVVMKRVGYSHVSLDTIKEHVQYGGGAFHSTSEDKFPDSDADPTLKTMITNLYAYLNTKPERKIEFVKLAEAAAVHLNTLSRTFNVPSCYNEATRRTIVDVFQLYSAAFVRSHCKLEAPVDLEDPGETSYFGNGPLDYYTERKACVINHIVQNADQGAGGGAMVPAEQLLEEEERMLHAITEAKGTLLMKQFAQLLAQMLDKNRSTSLLRKRTGSGEVALVRGILTTGQKTMFFGLKETNDGLPRLIYYGLFTLNILPKREHSLSGAEFTVDDRSGAATPKGFVNLEEVKNVLAAYISFLGFAF